MTGIPKSSFLCYGGGVFRICYRLNKAPFPPDPEVSSAHRRTNCITTLRMSRGNTSFHQLSSFIHGNGEETRNTLAFVRVFLCPQTLYLNQIVYFPFVDGLFMLHWLKSSHIITDTHSKMNVYSPKLCHFTLHQFCVHQTCILSIARSIIFFRLYAFELKGS